MPKTVHWATVQVSPIPQVVYYKHWDTQPVAQSCGQAMWMPTHRIDDIHTRQLAHGYNTGNYPAHSNTGNNYPAPCNAGNYPARCNADNEYPARDATHLESSGTVDGKGTRRQRGRRQRGRRGRASHSQEQQGLSTVSHTPMLASSAGSKEKTWENP